MWSFEHSIETSAAPSSVWRLYSDPATWPGWNGAVEAVEMHEPFGPGATGMLTPKGQGPLPLKIAHAAENEGYTSETAIAETVTLKLTNTLTPLSDGGTRITHHATFEGPAAQFFAESFGPVIAQGIPSAMQELANQAEKLEADAQ